MKILRTGIAVVVLVGLVCAPLLANAAGRADQDECLPLCPVQRPFFETVETCLAYALDLPLALISPIACPIVAPVMEAVDPVEPRTVSTPPGAK